MKKNNKIALIAVLVLMAIACEIMMVTSQSDKLEALQGSYTCISNGEKDSSDYVLYWKLDIKDKNFSLYDGEAGNPGIEGKIKDITKYKIIVDPNKYYESTPKNWKLEDNGKIEINYDIDGNKLGLMNSNSKLIFKKIK